MNALGIIFSDHYNDNGPINALTIGRTPSSLPYAGRYRTVDFALSSMVNANISNIGIIAKENYGSLIDHLGSGEDWDLNRKNGGLTMLTPLAHPDAHIIASRGRLEALRTVKGYIHDNKAEYIVMAFGGTVANLDLEKMVEVHKKNGAFLTLAAGEIPANAGEMTVCADESGKVCDVGYLTKATDKANCALNFYLMKRKDLLAFLEEADNKDYTNLNRELIQKNLETKKIFAYHHQEYARIIRTVEDYYTFGMEILDPALRKELFHPDRPVYTKIKSSVPAFYGFEATAENSLIADGCVINGSVKNSILFRGVVVEEGAVVENCILMQKSKVEKDSKIAYIITDKNAEISEGSDLRGAAGSPFVIGKGKRV